MTIHVSRDIIGSLTEPLTGQLAHIHRFTLVNDVTKMSVQYEDLGNPYIGATIGRISNRVSNGSFFIGGQEFQLSQNHGPNHLHGGFIGFDKVAWDLKAIHDNGVTFSHLSKDGHEGYPGELYATVRYTLHDDNSLRVYMTAKTTKPTMVNMTNHSYFNLAGHNAGSDGLYEHTVSIFAPKITKTNSDGIPTGETLPVLNTPYDFQEGANLGNRIRQIEETKKMGFDDYFCVERDNLGPKDITKIAKVTHPPSGRWMEVYSNQLGVQFYTGNCLPDPQKGAKLIKGRDKVSYSKHGAFCLEPHGYPDAPNHIHFPPILLKPEELYENWIIYKFGAVKGERPPIPRRSEVDSISYASMSYGGNSEYIEDDEVYESINMEVDLGSKAQSSGVIKEQEKKESSAVKDTTEKHPQQAEKYKTISKLGEVVATAAAAVVGAKVQQSEKPQSSGAIKKQEKKESSAVKATIEKQPKEEYKTMSKIGEAIAITTGAFADAILQQSEKPQSSGAIRKQEKKEARAAEAATQDPKEEHKIEAKKYKTISKLGEVLATTVGVVAGTVAPGGMDNAEENAEDDELMGACGGSPK